MLLLRLSLIFSTLVFLNSCATVISATTGDDGIQENKGRRSVGAVVDDNSIETAIKVNLNAADEQLKNAHQCNQFQWHSIDGRTGPLPGHEKSGYPGCTNIKFKGKGSL